MHKGEIQYLVKWAGMGILASSWVRQARMEPYRHLVEEFEAAGAAKQKKRKLEPESDTVKSKRRRSSARKMKNVTVGNWVKNVTVGKLVLFFV